MIIKGEISFGRAGEYVSITADSVEEFRKAVVELTAVAPAQFENVAQIEQAGLAAEILTKDEKEKASTPVARTKSSAPPNSKKVADKDGCRHGPWTEFEEGKYKYTKYCPGKDDDKCSFAELKAAGVR